MRCRNEAAQQAPSTKSTLCTRRRWSMLRKMREPASSVPAMKTYFLRKSSAEFGEKNGLPLGWVAISWRWLPDKLKRRHAHGRWYRLKSDHGVTYRVLRFGGNLSGSDRTNQWDMVIDWPAWLELSGYAEDVPDTLAISLSPTSIWRSPQLAFSHPDPTVRLATALGVLSLLLGIMSLALAVAVAAM